MKTLALILLSLTAHNVCFADPMLESVAVPETAAEEIAEAPAPLAYEPSQVSAEEEITETKSTVAIALETLLDRGQKYCDSLTKLYGTRDIRDSQSLCRQVVKNEVLVAKSLLKKDQSALKIYGDALRESSRQLCESYRGRVNSPIGRKCEDSRQAKLQELGLMAKADSSGLAKEREVSKEFAKVFGDSLVHDAAIYAWATQPAYERYTAAYDDLMSELVKR